jgi:hypothetical protein
MHVERAFPRKNSRTGACRRKTQGKFRGRGGYFNLGFSSAGAGALRPAAEGYGNLLLHASKVPTLIMEPPRWIAAASWVKLRLFTLQSAESPGVVG